jgi:hypothetical protein
MYKIILIIVSLFFSNVYAQFTITIIPTKIEEQEVNLKITITNITTDGYILPIDTILLSPYLGQQDCLDFQLFGDLDLGFIPMILDKKNNTFLEIISRNKGGSKSRNNIFEKYNKRIDKEQKKYIRNWKRKYNLYNESDKWIRINYHLVNHFITFNPFESISFEKSINFKKINEFKEVFTYGTYYVEKNKEYSLHLRLCVDKSVYNYLTYQQKKQYKKYKFFSGILESNKIELRN